MKVIQYLLGRGILGEREDIVFQVGQLIVYGNTGVCRVEKIGPPDLVGAAEGVDYYTLSPYYSKNSRIFTPCDNDKVVMRPVISKREAKKLVDDIPEIELLCIVDEKSREERYKETMRSCDCREFVSIIKTIYERKLQRLAEGKKVTASDEKYYNMAEDKLYGELAIALEMDKVKVKEYIKEKVES
ncbi:MAG: CarD family transcriptional regulator [Lachnospiraceae bacterium]|nr:CarD family transcriptional regulator [Lachnospiraceae bacterium]